MYAWVSQGVRSLVCCLLLFGLAQKASAQACATAIERQGQNHTDGLRLRIGDWSANVQFVVNVSITPLPSAVNPNPPAINPNWGGGGTAYSSTTGCCLINVGQTTPGWPAATPTYFGAQVNGLYKFQFTTQKVTSPWNTVAVGTFNAYAVGGVWTTEAPAVSPPPPGQPGASDPYAPPTDTQGHVYWTVLNQAAAASGATISVTGIGSTSTTTDPNGQATFKLYPGNWLFDISLNGKTARRSVALATRGKVYLTVNFDSAGNASFSGGGETPEEGGGSGSGGWLADILRSLFVPSQSAIDGVKKSFSALFQWGPFNLATQLVSLATLTPSGAVALSIPVPAWNTSCGCYSGVSQSVPIDTSAIASVPLWATVRMMLGAAVWLGFAFFVARSLMPKFTV
jgi:hypothetical protein